jgi:hypothetical protein
MALGREPPHASLAGLQSLASMNLAGFYGRDYRVLMPLLSHPWPEVRRRAAFLCLADYNSAEMFALLGKNPDPEVRTIVALRLARRVRPLFGMLTEALSSRHLPIRQGAMREAERWANNGFMVPIAALRKRLLDSSPDLRDRAFVLLDRAGPGNLTKADLLRALKGANPITRQLAAGALLVSDQYPKGHVEGIADLFADYNLYHQYRDALSKKPTARALYPQLLIHPNFKVRGRVAQMLVYSPDHDPALLPAIAKALAVGSSEKEELYRVLAKFGPAAVPVIEKRLEVDTYQAVNALRALGPDGAKPLLAAMKHKNVEVRSNALSSVSYATAGKGPEVRAAMAYYLKKASGSEKARAFRYIVPNSSAEEVATYLPYLRHATPAVRSSAARALAYFAATGPQTREGEKIYLALRKVALVPDWEQARAGVEGLNLMGPRARAALPVILARLKAARSADERRLCMNAATSLVRDNDAPASDLVAVATSLRKLMNSKDEAARHNAASAAGDLLARKALPASEAERLVARLRVFCRVPDVHSQQAALTALRNAGPLAREALPDIEPLLRHEIKSMRISALTLVWKLDPSSEAPWAAVLEALRGPDGFAANQMMIIVNKSGVSFASPGGRAVIAHLIHGLQTRSTADRSMTLLRNLGPKAGAALPALFEMVPHNYSARFTIRTIATGPEAMAQVGPFLRHPNDPVRSAAHEVANRLGPAALTDLLGALNDPDERIAIQAASSLSYMGSKAKEALPAMRQAAKKAKGTLKSSIDSAIRSAGG